MKKQFSKIANQPLAKTLKIILIIVIISIIFYFVANKIIKAIKPEEEDRDRKDINKDLKKEIDKNNLSYSDSQYESMSLQLAEAMRGFGTTEDTIFMIVNRMNNLDDWKYLQFVYNSKPRDIASYSWNNYTPDLITAFNEELDSSELAELNQLLINKVGIGL